MQIDSCEETDAVLRPCQLACPFSLLLCVHACTVADHRRPILDHLQRHTDRHRARLGERHRTISTPFLAPAGAAGASAGARQVRWREGAGAGARPRVRPCYRSASPPHRRLTDFGQLLLTHSPKASRALFICAHSFFIGPTVINIHSHPVRRISHIEPSGAHSIPL